MKPTQKIRKRTIILLTFLLIVVLGFCIPETYVIPVKKATRRDWHRDSFWYYPWGKSVVHKGIDIFAPEGRDIVASTGGLVIWKGEMGRGGNVVVVLGAKWHCQYYAHLKSYQTGWFSMVRRGETIGKVGTTGNAAGKEPHLHYAIFTLVPYPWRWDGSRQGWKKMMYLNPDQLLP